MNYEDQIDWDWDTFKEYDRTDAYTAEGNVEGRYEGGGVWKSFTACATKAGASVPLIIEGTIDVLDCGVIYREESD